MSRDHSRPTDWRAFEDGTPGLAVGSSTLPEGHDYQEGLQEFVVSRDVSLQTLTVARGGEGSPSQHIVARRSADGGATWGEWFDVEREGPPPSSYGRLVRHPKTGRITFMYTLGPATDPQTADSSPFYGHRHHVGAIAYRYVDKEGVFSERKILDVPLHAVDRENVFAGEHVLHYGLPVPQHFAGDDAYGWYTKLGPEPFVSNGEAFVVRYVGYAHTDALDQVELEFLPAGDHGFTHPGADCICGLSPIALQSDGWYFLFRSTTGHAGLAVTRDRGRTWDVGDLTYGPGGRPLKNPESPCVVVRDRAGRVFVAFYNDSYSIGYGSFAARDLVYLSHVATKKGQLHVTEPELFYYRRDQAGYEQHSLKRLNPPEVTLEGSEHIGYGADKLERRRFRIPDGFLDSLADQASANGVPQDGLLVSHEDIDSRAAAIRAPRLPLLSNGGGFTISFVVTLDGEPERLPLIDGLFGRGIRILTWRHGNLLFAMSDGKTTVRLESDDHSLRAGIHHVSVIVDGQPGLVSLVVDGAFQDGGVARERGTQRFGPTFGHMNRLAAWKLGGAGHVSRLVVHARALSTSEAVGLQRAMGWGR